MMLRHFLSATFAMLLVPSLAHATIVTLDFESSGGLSDIGPYIENGVSVTPNCHWWINNEDEGFGGSSYMSTSTSSCGGEVGDYNPDFPGHEWYQITAESNEDMVSAVLWIDAGGLPFDLLSFYYPFASWGHRFQITSSAGGVMPIHGLPEPGTATFTGPKWRNLDWVLVDVANEPTPHMGIDHLRVNVHDASAVPEPGMLLLLGLGAMMLRRKRECW